MELLKKIESKQATLGVIGLGYVGLPLAVEFARAGFAVVGYDVDAHKVAELMAGRSYIPDVPSAHLAEVVKNGKFKATIDPKALAAADIIDICVPTPLRKTKDPDMTYVVQAVEATAAILKKGQLIILESTTYPGTTVEVVQPVLAAKGFTPGVDFYLAFSPERVDPGNPQYQTKNIPKVVGGINEDSTKCAVAFYSQVMDKVVPVSSPSVAEMVKLLENTFRAVNIGLVNELALMCHRMGLDVWEVIDAAKTKPFGFMPFYPGPGLGGHCIPIDPFYLSWKARQYNFEARFIELAGSVNGAMPEFVVQRIIDALNSQKKSLNGSRVHIIGVAYKRDVNDLRESPALEVLELLAHRGAEVSYTDPYVPAFKHASLDLQSVDEKQAHEGVDCGVIITDHKVFDYATMVDRFPLLVDTRNALKGVARDHLFRL
ncbi:MAG: nucleotide sugar dehydrogenase [Vicinamibacterales bacterium]